MIWFNQVIPALVFSHMLCVLHSFHKVNSLDLKYLHKSETVSKILLSFLRMKDVFIWLISTIKS